MPRPPWLDRESDAWLRDGIISPEQRQAILDRYDSAGDSGGSTLLTWLAILAGAAGIVLLIIWNWDDVPEAGQLLLAFGATAAAYAGAVIAQRRSRAAVADRLTFLGSALVLGILIAVSLAYRADGWPLTAVWAIAVAISAALVPSLVAIVLGCLALGVWMVTHSGTPPPPWAFIAIWPLLALAVEEKRHRVSAGCVALSFGLWVFLVPLDIWPQSYGAAPAALLLAGAAIEAWTNLPASSRPAFARLTPAVTCIVFSLVFLQTQGIHRPLSGPLPEFGGWAFGALAIGLGITAISGLVTQGLASARPALLAILALAWLMWWGFAPTWTPAIQWTWSLTFSAAAVLGGASLVREAGRRRDTGLFVLGLLSVLSFIAVRAFDTRNVLWSALVLLAGAVGLWWLSRMWMRSRNETPGSAPELAEKIPSSQPRLLTIAAAGVLALAIGVAFWVHQAWPTWRGEELFVSATAEPQWRRPKMARLVFSDSRLRLRGVGQSSPRQNEEYVVIEPRGHIWDTTVAPSTVSQRLRGRRVYLQMERSGEPMPDGTRAAKAVSISDTPIDGALNVAVRVGFAGPDGTVSVSFASTVVPRAGAATGPAFVRLRVLPSGRHAVIGLMLSRQ